MNKLKSIHLITLMVPSTLIDYLDDFGNSKWNKYW